MGIMVKDYLESCSVLAIVLLVPLSAMAQAPSARNMDQEIPSTAPEKPSPGEANPALSPEEKARHVKELERQRVQFTPLARMALLSACHTAADVYGGAALFDDPN
jgi:hypothetical protein